MKRNRVLEKKVEKKEVREFVNLPVHTVSEVSSNVPPKRIGRLVSRLSNSIEVPYEGMSFKLPPRGRTGKDIEYNQLGALPKGVKFID